jgi:hypothetical protein
MLRNFLFALFSVIIGTSAFANGYCDSRPSQAERQRCYQNNADMYDRMASAAIERMKANTAAINRNANIPVADKKEFFVKVRNAQEAIDRQCKDNKCVANRVAGLNNAMLEFYKKYNPQHGK